ncbi:MAG: hypothetical protein IIV43_01630, partial [Oscillospiraceae bacterium]|nr:hypothetical protein [Oscillospiraceae bacterium]
TTFEPGTLMLISDHINYSGANPLIGQNLDAFGPRFPDCSDIYTKELREKVKAVAAEAGMNIREGVYMMFSGPNYETPAEVRMARIVGADAVGMSTVPEALIAAHCGMQVIGMSCITNMAAVGETGTKGIQILPNEGICTGVVDVVTNEHQCTWLKGSIYAACRIGQYQSLYAHCCQNTGRQGDFLHRQTFIEVDTSLQNHNALSHLFTKHQRTCMSRNGGLREVGNIFECNAHRILQSISKIPQTAAQHHTNGGSVGNSLKNIFRRCGNLSLQIHSNSSKSFFVVYHILPRNTNAPLKFTPLCFQHDSVSLQKINSIQPIYMVE